MDQLIERYKQGYSEIIQVISGLTEEQLVFKSSRNSWSIREIIIHVTDAELVHVHRLKAILSEDNPILTAFDQDLWTSRLNSQHIDQNHYLNLFKTLRESFLSILYSLNEEDFSRIGTHNIIGQLTFKEVFEYTVDHVDNHIEQIKRIKQNF